MKAITEKEELLKITPYKFQLEAMDFISSNPYCILALQMGMGKSMVALAVAAKYKHKTLVVCPAYLKSNWQNEIKKVLSDPPPITVVSYGILKNITEKYDYIIFDEAQNLKNIQAQRTRYAHKLISTTTPKRVTLLSGTPVRNKVEEFFSLLKICHYGKQYPEFDKYSNSFYGFLYYFTNKVTFKIRGKDITRFEGMKNIEDLKELIAPIYFRRKASQVLDLPRINKIFVKSASETSDYDDKLAEVYEAICNGKVPAAYATIKKANAMAKTEYTVNLAYDMIDNGKQIVIFSDHVDSAKAIAERLNGNLITGEVSIPDRVKLVEEFKSGEVDVLVCTVGSASTGINLTNCTVMIWNDLPYVPTDIAQAEKRIHRIGQTLPCFYYYIVGSEIDERIQKKLIEKIELIKTIT